MKPHIRSVDGRNVFVGAELVHRGMGVWSLMLGDRELAFLNEGRRFAGGVRIGNWQREVRGAGRELMRRYLSRSDAPRVVLGEWTPTGLRAAKPIFLDLGYDMKQYGKRFPNMLQITFHKGPIPRVWGGEQ